MSEAPHLDFIVAAYAVATIVIAGMIAAVLFDYRSLRAQLRALDTARGEETET